MLLFSVIFPLFALIIDFFFNRLVTSYKHAILNVLIGLLYIFLSFLGSAAQQRPVYGDHLGYFTHSDFRYDLVTPEGDWAKQRLAQCQDHFSEWTKLKSNIPVNWTKNAITLATIFGSIIVSHVLLTFLHNTKSKRYFIRDGQISDKKAKLLENKH